MIIGIPSESGADERRVAFTPANVEHWTRKGAKVLVQANAGLAAGHRDADYEKAGAIIVANRADIFAQASVVLQVQAAGSPGADADLELLRPGQVLAGMMDPLADPSVATKLAERKVTAIAMELVPRISRAQSMDVLSSMATLGGYKAVLLGAMHSPRILPMMMTAAGTLNPARVFIMGAGVAGLQACATAKRLGAVVEAYDVRPAARDQIISVGAKPIELDLDTGTAEGKGGYAQAQGEDFLKRQRELMTEVLAQQDIVITTAAVPGAKSPILITAEMVKGMKPGTVIVDMAAERGGNCELTRPGEVVVENDVIIVGPVNLPASVANHASQMYGKNMEIMLGHILSDECALHFDFEDEIITETVIAHEGQVPHARMREMLGLPALTPPAESQ